MKKGILLLILSTILCFSFSRIFGQTEGVVPDSLEYQALVDLYNSTDGDFWFDNTGWLIGNDFSTWFGVTVVNGDVAILDLSFNDLTGNIPGSIGNLKALEELLLEYNYLEGVLPEEVGMLENLLVLRLRFNFLASSLPETISNLSQLQVLDLFVNAFDGKVPDGLWNLQNLIELDLSYNNFEGTIPLAIGNLLNLEILGLTENLFTGEFPSTIGNLTNLFDLFISNNFFTGQLPSTISNLQNLENLAIDDNSFEGPLPEALNTLPFLSLFWVDNNDFTSFPDFSGSMNASQLRIYAENNKLDFSAFEKNFTGPGQHIFSTIFFYAPQDSIYTFFDPGSFTFHVEVEGQFNQYQWKKNGIDILGANLSRLVLDQNTYNEADTYQCVVTNSRVTDLTLYSKTKYIRAGEYWAIADGTWNSLIWAREKDGPLTDTYPGEGSEVFIVGHNITLSQNLSCGSINVIVEHGDASLVVDGAEVTVTGEVRLIKNTEGYPGNVKVINGGRVVTVN